MTDQNDLPAPAMGVRLYQVICFTALGVIFLVQWQQGFLLENLLLAAVGALGTLLRLRGTPLLVLLVLAGTYFMRQLTWGRLGLAPAAFQVNDVLLCGGLLAFVMGHYRLQGLTLNVVPLDPRRRRGRPRWDWIRLRRLPPLQPQSRSPALVAPPEVARLILSLPLCALLAQVLWLGLGWPWEFLGIADRFSRLLLAGWVLGLGLLVLSGLYRFWRQRQLTAAEAAMFLQDTLWSETRREQRRLQRWLAWQRLRT